MLRTGFDVNSGYWLFVEAEILKIFCATLTRPQSWAPVLVPVASGALALLTQRALACAAGSSLLHVCVLKVYTDICSLHRYPNSSCSLNSESAVDSGFGGIQNREEFGVIYLLNFYLCQAFWTQR